LKEINTSLTDEDLVYEEGQDAALLQRLASILKMSTSEVKDLIESISYNEGNRPDMQTIC
jgi:hypothetical protein